MTRTPRDHPANEDEADRHVRPRRVPAAAAIGIAILAVAALAFLRAKGMNW
jgi:hypothetical protein